MGAPADRPRKRGSIRQRRNSFQVRVFAGDDAVTGQPRYLTESLKIAPARTEAARERAEREAYAKAERALTRLQAKVDEQRSARTAVTLRTAFLSWLQSHEVAETTKRGHEAYLHRYIGPRLGDVPVGKITAKTLEGFYAELRRCRLLCDGRPFIEHRTDDAHECRVVRHRRPAHRPSPRDRAEHDCAAAGCTVVECSPHKCRPLAAQTIRQVHFAIQSTLAAAVRWEWITANPATVAKKPRQPTPSGQIVGGGE